MIILRVCGLVTDKTQYGKISDTAFFSKTYFAHFSLIHYQVLACIFFIRGEQIFILQ